MTEHDEKMSEREEVEMLLPWYVSGKLAPKDQRRVEDYLNAHPDMAHQLKLIEDEAEASITSNEEISGAPAGSLDRLLAEVTAYEKKRVVANIPRRLWAWTESLANDLTAPKLRWAAAAVATIVAIQAVTIGVLLVGDGTQPQFKTASGDKAQPAATGVIALVRFTPEASINEIGSLLETFGASIVAGPMPGGIYRIRLSAENLSDKDAIALIERFKSSNKMISFAAKAPGAKKP